jgi:uncharacterized protein YcbX
MLEADERKSFVKDAAIHLVNEASVRDIKAKVMAKYEDEEEK